MKKLRIKLRKKQVFPPSIRRFCLLSIPIVIQFSCSSSSFEKKNEQDLIYSESVAVKKSSAIPRSFPLNNPYSTQFLNVPSELLSLGKILRKRVEVREGPGTKYKIKEKWLINHDKVIIFNKIGKWQKIISIKKDLVGWVHHKTLTGIKIKDELVKVKSSLFPSVFSVRTVNSAYDFKNEKKLSVFIPKGRAFIALNMKKRRNLVWIKETNSVIWLNVLDVK